MEMWQIISALSSIGIFVFALFSILIGIFSASWSVTNRRLTRLENGQVKLEEGQAKLEKRMDGLEAGQARFDKELKEIKHNQARFEREITLKLDQLLSQTKT